MKQNIRFTILCLALATAMAPVSCKESGSTIPLDTIVTSLASPPGYYYPRVEAFLPTVNPAPVNTQAYIIFNLPIDPTTISGNITVNSFLTGNLVEGVANDFELSLDGTVVAITFHYGGGPNPLLASDTITVTTGTGVHDLDRGLGLTASDVRTFTTGTAPDTTPPAISGAAGSTGPTGVNIELTDASRIAASHDIHVVFTEDMDPSSINNSTFYLEDDLSAVVPATLAYAPATYRATLTPLANLEPGVTYTVYVTTGVRDLSQNNMAAPTSWTFTTTFTPLDPKPGNPVLSNLYVDSVADDGASVSWSTDEPANYRLNYGRGSDTISLVDGSADYASFHTVDLAGLDTNARYFFNIDFTDLEDYLLVDWTTTPTYQVNTESAENPLDVIDGGADEQHNPKTIPYRPIDGSATGFFLFWDVEDQPTTYRHIYGQLYDNAFSGQWNGAARQPLFTGAGTWNYESAASDEAGGAIVIARNAANIAYAKRKLAAGAALEWGYAAADPGLQVRNVAISSVSAVPVYAGMVQRITPVGATAEMSSWYDLNNPFFDDDGILGGLTDGDIIMDPVNHDGTTIDINSGAGQDFTYMAGQDAVIIASGDTYQIGSGTDMVTETAQDHETYRPDPPATMNDDVSGSTPTTSDFYTTHGFTLPGGWTLDPGDIVRNGASFGNLTALSQLTRITVYDTGLADGGGDDHLLDSTKAFTWWWDGFIWKYIAVGDRVVNEDDSLLSYVTVVNDFDLTLNNPPLMSFNNNDAYSIYSRYCVDHQNDLNQFDPFYQFTSNWPMVITAGTSFSIYDNTGITGTAQDIPASPLCDNTANFSFNGVAAGDIVVNFTQHTSERVSAAATYAHMLSMDSQIIADGDEYGIIRFGYMNTDKDDILCAGIATSGTPATLGDTGVNFTTLPVPVQPGDIAYNYTAGNEFAMITAVAANALTLSRNAGFAASSRYVIIRRRGVMFLYLNGANVTYRVLSMEGTPPVQVYPTVGTESTIAAGSDPRALSDGNGNAIVVYVSGGKVRATKINCIGTVAWGPIQVDSLGAAVESILDVQTDTAGGVVVLYKYSGDIHAQRIDSTGTRQWGASGLLFDNDGAAPALVTADEVMHYIYPDDVVVTATVDRTNLPAIIDDVYAWRRGFGGANDWATAITSLGTDQARPQLYINGDASVVVWDDNRFYNQSYIDTGYAIFGQNFHYSDGTRQWDADAGAGSNFDGVSIVLNHYNEAPGYPLVVSYNDGAKAVLIWEDFRAGLGGDILFRNLDGFTPP